MLFGETGRYRRLGEVGSALAVPHLFPEGFFHRGLRGRWSRTAGGGRLSRFCGANRITCAVRPALRDHLAILNGEKLRWRRKIRTFGKNGIREVENLSAVDWIMPTDENQHVSGGRDAFGG